MVMRIGIIAGLLVMIWHQSLGAVEVEPLKNGYSAVEPQTAALLQAQPDAEVQSKADMSAAPQVDTLVNKDKLTAADNKPRLSVKLEQGADKILSSKGGVSAALGAALTATVSTNPATVLVGGLAGIWAGEQRFSYCGCETMELGEKASSLFRTVSKTFFRGGRAVVDGTKVLADKTGKNINKIRYANAPMPMKGQEQKIKAEVETKPAAEKTTTKPKTMAAIPAEPKPIKPVVKKVQPPVITAAKKTKPLAEKKIAKKPKQVATAEKTPAKKQATIAKAKKEVPKKPKLVTKSKAETTLRASSKKLQPMPKVVVAETIPQPEQELEEPLPWPEKAVVRVKKEPPVQRVSKAQMASPKENTLQAYTSPADSGQKMAANVTKAVDCDGSGDKVSRGRLAWMECYYRMDTE